MFDSLFPSHWTTLRKLMWLKLKGASAVWSTISGNPVSFTAVSAPLRQLEVAFSPVQEGSGDPSPDNVRPISGWDSLNVWQTGKNLLDTSKGYTGVGYNATDGTEISLTETGNYTISGNKISFTASGWAHRDFLTPPLKEGDYRVRIDTTGVTGVRVSMYTIAPDGTIQSHSNSTSASVITNTRHPFDGGRILISLGTNTAQTLEFSDVQVESGTETTAWEAPNIRSISISIGQTVYSGTVDVLTGVVTVDMASVDLGTLTWAYESTNKYFYSSTITSQLYNPFNYQSHEQGILSDRFVVPDIAVGAADSLWATMPTNTIAKHCGAKNYIYLKKTEYTSPLDLQAAVTGSQLVFKLATPLTIQLTPQEVSSLLGENNMWSDANGDLTVEYRSN